MDFSGKKICILGLSKSGISAAKHLCQKDGTSVVISEKREEKEEDKEVVKELLPLGIKVEMGDNKEQTIQDSDLIVVSPGISPEAPVYGLIRKYNKPFISEIDVAYLEAQDKTFIAITGTNGKTTTTKLVAQILQEAGLKAKACGNIGTTPTSILSEEVDYFVCEVSSFQIETSSCFKPDIACFLNYSPDHIDWHGSEKAYFDAKKSLFDVADKCILNENDGKVFSLKDCCKRVAPFGKTEIYIEDDILKIKGEEILAVSEMSLIGTHNLENIMAATCIANILGIDNEVLKNVLRTFEPPEHRLEYVCTIDGKKYYNDSKATNVDAAIKSIEAFNGSSLALIAGGKDKGTNLDDFVTTIQQNVDYVILIGEATKRFETALIESGYKNILNAETLEEAIDIASDSKSVGDVQNILLAPACASFDMFKSFEDRGKVFKEYVLKKQEQ